MSNEGKVIRKDCQLCHTIIAQESKVPRPADVEVAEKFRHPWLLKEKHARLSCNQCHLRGRGLVAECATCHARPAGAPMAAFACGQCHLKDQAVRPQAPCAMCHPARSELHLKATHAASACTTCHLPHEWKTARRESCLGCHADKTAHNAGVVCANCHQFRALAKAS